MKKWHFRFRSLFFGFALLGALRILFCSRKLFVVFLRPLVLWRLDYATAWPFPALLVDFSIGFNIFVFIEIVTFSYFTILLLKSHFWPELWPEHHSRCGKQKWSSWPKSQVRLQVTVKSALSQSSLSRISSYCSSYCSHWTAACYCN